MKALLTRLDHDRGMNLHAEDTFYRGSLLNIQKKVEIEGPEGPVVIPDAVLDSDSVVVDIQGGKPFRGPKSPTTPGEMVILQSDGSLVVHDELDDEPSYQVIQPTDSEATTAGGDSILSDDPYGKLPKGDAAPKKSRLETLKGEAEKKRKKKAPQ